MENDASNIYLHTISNSQMDKYPNNEPHSYINSFNPPILLKNDSKITLLEFEYPTNLIANDERCLMEIFVWTKERPIKRPSRKGPTSYYGKKYIRHLGLESFTNGTELAACLNNVIFLCDDFLKHKNKKLFSYDPEINRLIFNGSDQTFTTLKFHGKLLKIAGAEKKYQDRDWLILGANKDRLTYLFGKELRYFHPDFRQKLVSDEVNRNSFPFAPILHQKINSMFIYCNLFSQSFVAGRNYQPIARIVPYESFTPAKRVLKNFSSGPIFKNCRSNQINSIQVSIKSDLDENVLLNGPVRCTFLITKI